MSTTISEADALYQRVAHVIPRVEWATMVDDVQAILRLKAEKNAVILAHNYMTPEIYHGVADIVGDSLALAREATKVDADVIVLAGVHFMAETAKLLNPSKTVLIPDLRSGCSLAESVTPEDVRALRAAHPGVPVVTYVNTSAAVKAESDICCTSGNAVKIIESLGVDEVIMIPDQFLAANIGAQTGVKMIVHPGACEVHERFTPDDIETIREGNPGVTVIAHPECPRPVVLASDFSGSTAQMQDFIEKERPRKVALITECSMSDNIAQNHPEIDFIRPCNMCPHMKRNTLAAIRHSLETLTNVVELDPATAAPARQAIERMLAVK
ncbi:MAG: quinolinate synthase NadA [Propionibacteriaceae bacterium]|uniref:quinolinate synthase NadA n=1 Tax=Dietzia sp. UBA5065 TaxID=1946422 RepID=UPI000E8EADBD|nr:quinolinate synthase NadA [Dietzia sp. UBA5065]MBK9157399.1 quinolinate synthase NadA [Micropruina sp.]HBX82002.1 quinolinate synthase [Propionibacteriaceae bacterium]HBY24175.1 quinolinate synthase [Propionibacteriaceae bacterium]